MKNPAAPKKFFSQKGQGLVEYALLICLVAGIAVYATLGDGFGGSITNLFGGSSDNLASVKFISDETNEEETDESAEEATSFDYETQRAEDISPPTYKTLNWMQINVGMQAMYGTVMGSDTPDKALVSEVNLFGEISAMTEGHLASTKAEDGTKDWENFLSTIERSQNRSGFKSSYKRGEETIMIQRLGNSNTVQLRYSDGKEVVYYRLSPDANNVMQIETNSNKPYAQFFSPIVNSGGWEYNS